jgi:hypothetical protein
VPYGDHDKEDFDTFTELAQSHCDNAMSPRALDQIDYRGDDAALVKWVEKELAR